jgi:hypothetical protein
MANAIEAAIRANAGLIAAKITVAPTAEDPDE